MDYSDVIGAAMQQVSHYEVYLGTFFASLSMRKWINSSTTCHHTTLLSQLILEVKKLGFFYLIGWERWYLIGWERWYLIGWELWYLIGWELCAYLFAKSELELFYFTWGRLSTLCRFRQHERLELTSDFNESCHLPFLIWRLPFQSSKTTLRSVLPTPKGEIS